MQRFDISKCLLSYSVFAICINKSIELNKEALAIRHIFSLVDMITKAKFSNTPNDFKINLFG